MLFWSHNEKILIALLWIKLFSSESFIITIINEKLSSSIVRWTEMTRYLPLVWLLIHISCVESLFPRTLVFPPALVLMGGTTEGFRMKIIRWTERSRAFSCMAWGSWQTPSASETWEREDLFLFQQIYGAESKSQCVFWSWLRTNLCMKCRLLQGS